MRKTRNLKLACVAGFSFLVAAACGQSPINNSSDDTAVDTSKQDLDGDGRPDQFDNCPNVANPGVPMLWDGDPIACAVPENGLLPEDPVHFYVTGEPRPEVCDGQDNCAPEALYCVNGVIVTQPNWDHDAQGDACDPNDDNDNWADDVDLCPQFVNVSNGDLDGDGQGDECDPDDDNDGVLDTCGPGSPEGCMPDNCPTVANSDQADMDFDGRGDACDEFQDCAGDEDGIPDAPGACLPPDAPPVDPNQVDSDSDGESDATDCDSGNPLRSHNLVEDCDDMVDNDCDGLTDAADADCDPDLDDDGVLNAGDNCPDTANPGQEDMDMDGAGDACDQVDNRLCSNGGDMCAEGQICVDLACQDDPDGDGVGDSDNCPNTPNADQADMDMDGLGDVCDEINGLLCINGGASCDAGWVCLNGQCVVDTDGDGTGDVQDNCPMDSNADQADADMDGMGDACDACVNDAGGLNACGACGAVPEEVCGDAVDNDCDGATNEGCDTDGDLIPDACDPGAEGCMPDNCPAVANASQMDRDLDGMGDVCDPDCTNIRTAQGWTLNFTLSSVIFNGYPVGPWDQSGDTELCVYQNEGLLFIATDGQGHYSLTGWPAVDNAAAFLPGYGPMDAAGFNVVLTPSGPDYLRLPQNN